MDRFLDIAWLKANHRVIHYFGLGFIQLKVDAANRLHFYTPELPPITPEEDVHTHRYDFTSKILKGRFRQDLYLPVVGDTHLREQETCTAVVAATEPPTPCGLVRLSTHCYEAGSSYLIDHRAFHRVMASDCITHLDRGEYKTQTAEVIRPVGTPKVCPFSQPVEEARLWDIVERMLRA